MLNFARYNHGLIAGSMIFSIRDLSSGQDTLVDVTFIVSFASAGIYGIRRDETELTNV